MKKTLGILLLLGTSLSCFALPTSIVVSNSYALIPARATLPAMPPAYGIVFPNLTFTPILTIYMIPGQPGKTGLPPGWADAHPGYGIIVHATSTPITFQVPDGPAPVLPLALPAGYSLVCCQTNLPATFGMIVGRAPDPGTLVFRLLTNGVGSVPADGYETNYSVYAFTNGAWNPEPPVADVGEAVWIYQPPMISSLQLSGTNLSFGALTGVGSVTAVEYTDSLTGTWQVLTNISGSGGISNVLDVVDGNAPTQRFYRLNMKNNSN